MRIVRWIEQSDRARLAAAIDAIFFEASSVRSFAGDGERAAFRNRWLGLYLDAWPEHVWLARNGAAAENGGALAGYLIGSLVDPAMDRRFDDLAYFRDFAHASAVYPAHLHINLAPAYRNRGIGERLVQAFAGQARRAGEKGLHIVTSKGARNVGFYRRCGFEVVAEAPWKRGVVLFMGLRLDRAHGSDFSLETQA